VAEEEEQKYWKKRKTSSITPRTRWIGNINTSYTKTREPRAANARQNNSASINSHLLSGERCQSTTLSQFLLIETATLSQLHSSFKRQNHIPLPVFTPKHIQTVGTDTQVTKFIMAFDIPVEADRVDLSFSTRTSITGLLMRVPMILIGFLLYLLVGFLEQPTEEDSEGTDKTEDFLPYEYSSIVLSGPTISYYQDPRIKSALKHKNSLPKDHLPPPLVRFETEDSSIMDDDFSYTSSSCHNKRGIKWADENGHRLVDVVHF